MHFVVFMLQENPALLGITHEKICFENHQAPTPTSSFLVSFSLFQLDLFLNSDLYYIMPLVHFIGNTFNVYKARIKEEEMYKPLRHTRFVFWPLQYCNCNIVVLKQIEVRNRLPHRGQSGINLRLNI